MNETEICKLVAEYFAEKSFEGLNDEELLICEKLEAAGFLAILRSATQNIGPKRTITECKA